jgi:hypothetical protein
MSYVASNPGDAPQSAADAVRGYLPKLFSTFSINPFRKMSHPMAADDFIVLLPQKNTSL